MRAQTTQIDAFHSLTPEYLATCQGRVLKTIADHNGICNAEISQLTGMPINVVTARTNELMNRGRVIEVGKGESPVSGRRVILWGLAPRA